MNQQITDEFFNALFRIEIDGKPFKEILAKYFMMGRGDRQKNRNWTEKIKVTVIGGAFELDGKFIATDGSILAVSFTDIKLDKEILNAGFKGMGTIKEFIMKNDAFITSKPCKINGVQFWCQCFDLQKIINRYF